jgi:hypothetical protein
MPLLDHFHPPLSRSHPWRTFHGSWAAAMARLLNAGVLPAGFYAAPFLDRHGPLEIDVAALHEPGGNGTATGPAPAWSPPAPALDIVVEWPPTDDVGVEIVTDDGDPRLAAAIELVSPANKDRPQKREALAVKCAEHLRRGAGVVVVDVVTTRHADLQADLFAALGVEPPTGGTRGLSAVSYRPAGRGDEGRLLAWSEALEVGRPLPTLPLWLDGELPVPLDLESSHQAACDDLRIRRAG